jgi:hypothetical protein
MIHAKIGDNLIDLSSLNPQKSSIEKSFDLEPRVLQSAIKTGSFEITESLFVETLFLQLQLIRSPVAVRCEEFATGDE